MSPPKLSKKKKNVLGKEDNMMMLPLTQVNFAEVCLPIYYKYVTPENIKAGFAKCGLLPFNPDVPDYSKLESSAAEKGTCLDHI